MTPRQTIIQSNPINNIGRSQSSEVVQSGVQTQGQVTGLSPSGVRGNIMLDEVGGGNNRLRGDGAVTKVVVVEVEGHQFNLIFMDHMLMHVLHMQEKIQQDQLGYFYHKIMVITLWHQDTLVIEL